MPGKQLALPRLMQNTARMSFAGMPVGPGAWSMKRQELGERLTKPWGSFVDFANAVIFPFTLLDMVPRWPGPMPLAFAFGSGSEGFDGGELCDASKSSISPDGAHLSLVVPDALSRFGLSGPFGELPSLKFLRAAGSASFRRLLQKQHIPQNCKPRARPEVATANRSGLGTFKMWRSISQRLTGLTPIK